MQKVLCRRNIIMAIREIRKRGDSVLTKVARPVEKFDARLKMLVEDMIDTMYDADGVGLAAPQVGILKRVVVVDVYDGEGARVLINPEFVEQDGEQFGEEGCLSVPGVAGNVLRPNHVVIKAFDENGEEFVVEGTELLARALCHELDHLDGILFTQKATEIEEA